jgi:spore maturation protein A
MLNYIWAGLIVASLLFAGVSDARDLARDSYRNGQALPLALAFPDGYESAAREQSVEIRIDPVEYGRFYGTDTRPPPRYPGRLVQSEAGRVLRFGAAASLPEPLATIAQVSRSNDGELQGALVRFDALAAAAGDVTAPAAVGFEAVRFVKLNAISAAALDFAETAASIALGLIGILALFLGMLKIAEAAGVIYALVKLVRPVLRPLFPDIPPDHPALGMIALNLTANVFGLGNAATPFGIKAMEELQTLNPTEDTATNSMVTFLAVNTASVQLVPPVLLIALMGLQINQLIVPIILTTGTSLVVAIVASRLYQRLPSVSASDPHRADAGTPPLGS